MRSIHPHKWMDRAHTRENPAQRRSGNRDYGSWLRPRRQRGYRRPSCVATTQADFVELFDLSADPHELHNIAASAPAQQLAQLQARLLELRGCAANATVTCP